MPRTAGNPWIDDGTSHERLISVARSMIVARRALHGPLPPAILDDTALALLLRLFVAGDDSAGAAIPVANADLQIDIAAAESTVTRWLAVLRHDGLVAFGPDGVALTAHGHARMVDAIGAVIQSQIALHGPSTEH